MTTKFLNSLKAVVVFCFVLFSIISCEKDFENIGVNIVDNNLFNTDFEDFTVIGNTNNVEASRVDGLTARNLGILFDTENNFGRLEASLISQIGLPTPDIDFGLNPVLDTVILEIPYFATLNSETNENGGVNFTLDSIFGDQEAEFKLKVARLTTFLNTLDPNDPTQNKRYFSNEVYNTSDILFNDNFKPNKNDTVLLVKRQFFTDDESVDTIFRENRAPSIKLPLDENLMTQIFITNATSGDLSSVSNFSNYFRGVKITPEEITANVGTMMTLNTSGANIAIYYTNEILTDEDGEDLNDNGTTDDQDVPVKTKQTLIFPFSGVSASSYDRDYTSAEVLNFANQNFDDGSAKVFVQGSAGSNAEIALFNEEELEAYRSKNWLINGAILDLYVDDSASIGVPSRLYLYKEDNTVIKDVISEAQVLGIGGFLQNDDDGNPESYRFFITDYISDLLSENSTLENSKLILKAYHPTDNVLSFTDTIVRDFSWNVKGVVLKGNLPKEDEKRINLRIYYTEN